MSVAGTRASDWPGWILIGDRAAMIYQHEARGADKRITGAIDAHVQAERGNGDEDDGAAGVLVPTG